MRFDRGRADGQPPGDLHIVQPLDHQRQNFTFALRQVEAGRRRQIGSLNQRLGSFGGEGCASRMGGADGPNQIIRRDILK